MQTDFDEPSDFEGHPTVPVTLKQEVQPDYIDENGNVKFKSVDDAVRLYVEERDALSAYMKQANAHEAAVKERMAKISMWLRDKGDELGIDSFRTQHGTAYRNVKTSYRMGDWNAFIDWVQRTDNFQCLEKRVAKNATKEVHDDTGEVPPGIEYVAEVEFNVRRPTKARGE